MPTAQARLGATSVPFPTAISRQPIARWKRPPIFRRLQPTPAARRPASFRRAGASPARRCSSTPAISTLGPAEFQFSGLQARSVEIRVVNIGERPAALSGRCDGTIVVGPGGRAIAAGEPVRLSLSKAEVPGSSAVLYPGPDLDRCELTVRSQGAARRLTILREEVADPDLARFDSLYQRCPSPDPARLSPLERAFYASRELSETCPMPIGRPKLLLDERDGFNAKVEALAGSRLPDSFFEQADPEAPIDLSRAPKLKLIYFSYLDFKADFSGRVMERLIRHHAAQGTKVRITVTAVLEREKDRALLRRMAADYPNIQLQEFAWDPATGAPVGEQLSRFYKTHHVKMLATIASDPRRSRAIIGGRNIHDGFLFHDPLDLSRYPDLHQYRETNGLSLNYYSNWSDFDIEFTEPAKLVETLTAHLATLWHRDAKTNLSRPFSIAGQVRGASCTRSERAGISSPCPMPTGGRWRTTMSNSSTPPPRRSTSSIPIST